MKLYKRQIRPMVSPPALHGMNCHNYPIEEEEIWYDDCIISSKDVAIWEDEVLSREGQLGTLVFKERFVPITKEDFIRHATTFDFDDATIGGFHDC